jgi:hypothetical protein
LSTAFSEEQEVREPEEESSIANKEIDSRLIDAVLVENEVALMSNGNSKAVYPTIPDHFAWNDLDDDSLRRRLASILPCLLVEFGDRELQRVNQYGEAIYDRSQPLTFGPTGEQYALTQGKYNYHAANFVYNTAYRLGYEVPVSPLYSASSRNGRSYKNTAATFAALAGDPGVVDRDYFLRYFDVIVRPGQSGSLAIRPGDILLRGAEPGAPFGHIAFIVDPTLHDMRDPFFASRDALRGRGVQCIDAGLSIHKREDYYGQVLTDEQGNVFFTRMVLRFKEDAIDIPRVREQMVRYARYRQMLEQASGLSFTHQDGNRKERRLQVNPLEPNERVLDSELFVEGIVKKVLGKANQQISGNAQRALQAPSTPQQKSRSAGCLGAGMIPIADISVHTQNGTTYGLMVCIGDQRVLPGVITRRFAGFRTLYHALAEASMSRQATAIVRDITGRYRVYETNIAKQSLEANSVARITPRESSKGGPFFNSLRLVHLEEPADKTPWAKLLDLATTSSDYIDLISLISGLERNEINLAEPFGSPLPKRLNFGVSDPLLQEVPGITGFYIRDPDIPNKDIYKSTHLQVVKDGPLPFAAFTIGKNAFVPASPVYTLGVIVHEATHEHHFLRTLEVIQAWQKSKSDNFDGWLGKQRDQKTKIAGRAIDLEDFQVVAETRNQGGATTQTIAMIEAFMSTYHHPDFPLEGSAKSLHFSGLRCIDNLRCIDHKNVWDSVYRDLQSELLTRLVTYYNGLDKAHQEVLKTYLSENVRLGNFHKQFLAKLS